MILKEYDLSVRLPQERAIDTGITLVQNDKDVYKLNVRIFDGVNEIDYSEVDSATITFLKGDKNVVQGDMTVDADKLSYTLGTNEIACPGKVLVGIQLFGTTERLSTARFVMSVERDLVTAEAVQSTSEFPILQQLKQDLEAIDVVELTNEFDAHMAETMSEVIVAQRDISITGVQTISTNRRVKSAVCFASISANAARSNGVLAEDGTQRVVGIRGYDNTTVLQNAFVNIMTTSASVFALGVVENITDSSFDIRWTNNNSPIGTVTMYILLQYHGGDV